MKELNITHSKWVNDKYAEFYNQYHYLPKYFDVYNGGGITDYAPSITTRSNGAMGSGTLLVLEIKNENIRTSNKNL